MEFLGEVLDKLAEIHPAICDVIENGLCAVSLKLDTGGLLPRLDGREFSVKPPF